MLQYLQQTQNLTAQQQGVLNQLTHQYKLMQQHQQQLRTQQQQQQLRGAHNASTASAPANTNSPAGSQTPTYQHPGTPQSGATAQTGFSPGMPFKSASNYPQHQISSTTNQSELGKNQFLLITRFIRSNASYLLILFIRMSMISIALVN